MAAKAGRLTALMKQAWNEIPETVCGLVLGVVSLAGAFTALHFYEKNDMDNSRYKYNFLIMRPDDPRVARIKRD